MRMVCVWPVFWPLSNCDLALLWCLLTVACVCVDNWGAPRELGLDEREDKAMAAEYRRTDLGGWARLEDWHDGMGRPVWCHVSSGGDTSAAHQMYPSGYDDRCGWCWLGACHSDEEHAARVARASA